ncbi:MULTISPECIES: hypothetical protein, partial [Paraburkholderia]|uniref:hypothetical protein n=1 Tax=Paraburkholderia TaxID=1822464 RepID=UPI0038BB2FFD
MSPVDVLRAPRHDRIAGVARAGCTDARMRRPGVPQENSNATGSGCKAALTSDQLNADDEQRVRDSGHLFFIRTYGHISNN